MNLKAEYDWGMTMFASRNCNAAVLDLGFLGMPLQSRLFETIAVPVYGRRREGIARKAMRMLKKIGTALTVPW